jgi:hypothetical protein
MMGMVGGGATMIADGNFLYVLQGNRLMKINKDDLKVAKTGELPMPQGRPNNGGPAGPPPGGQPGGGGEAPSESPKPATK